MRPRCRAASRRRRAGRRVRVSRPHSGHGRSRTQVQSLRVRADRVWSAIRSSSACRRSASRSSTVSMPDREPDQVGGHLQRRAGDARVRHPVRVLDQRLDAAERLAEREHPGAVADRRAPPPRRRPPGTTPCRRTGASAWPRRRGRGARRGPGSAPPSPAGARAAAGRPARRCRSAGPSARQRLDPAQHQPRVERPGHRAHRVLVVRELARRAARPRPPARRRRRRSGRRGTSSSSARPRRRRARAAAAGTARRTCCRRRAAPRASCATCGQRGDVGDAEQRVGRRLDPDHLGPAGADRGPHRVDVGQPRPVVCSRPQRSSTLANSRYVPPYASSGMTTWSPGDADRAQQGVLGGQPGGEGQPAAAALERGQALLQRRAGRVAAAAVLVAARAARRRRPACTSRPGRSAARRPRWSGPGPGRRGSRASRNRRSSEASRPTDGYRYAAEQAHRPARTGLTRAVETPHSHLEDIPCCSVARPTMVDADQALPGRPVRPFSVPKTHAVLGTPLEGPWPAGLRGRLLRPRLLLGRRGDLLAGPRRLLDGRRLHGRLHAQPDVRGDVHRPDRPHRGGPGRLRPGPGLVRDAAEGVLGEPRPDPGVPAGQRRRHPVPVRPRTGRRPTQQRRAGAVAEDVRRRAGSARGTTRSRPRSVRRRTFYYAEDYHQQYLHKVPHGYRCHSETGVPYPES